MAETKHTAETWRAISMGGMSTVVTTVQPPRNDLRTNNSYGYLGEEFCIGAPFLEDDGRPRLDFIQFGHDHARLIAAAPDLLEALTMVRDRFFPAGQPERDQDILWPAVNGAIAKAEGRS